MTLLKGNKMVMGYYLFITWITSVRAGNLALRQPASLSSVFKGLRYPSYAVDGHIGGDSTKCAVSNDNDPYWFVDLGRSHIVDEVYVLGRSDCCLSRMFGFQIRVGDKTGNETVSNPLCRTYQTFSDRLDEAAKCVPGMRGRYVSIHLPGVSKELCVCEVKINRNPTANLALRKTAYQSTMDGSGKAERAVDGISDSRYDRGSCTLTTKQKNPWWRVDLGSSKPVSEVFLVNRDTLLARLKNFVIRIGDIKHSNGYENPMCGNGLQTMETLYKKSFYCKPRRTGRYVYVALDTKGSTEVLTLCEVKVYSESKAVVHKDNAVVIQGFPLSLECAVSGYPEPFVAWARNGVVYQNTTATNIFRHNALNENRNGSEWECIVTNIHGSDFLTFEIKGESWHRMCAKNEALVSKRTVLDLANSTANVSGDEAINNSVWFRLRHPTTLQGMQIPESCTAPMHCSTQATGWMLGSHPDIPDGVVRRTVCFSWDGDCCRYNTSILVRRCHGFYVYKLEKTSFDVRAGYCAEISKTSNEDVMFQQVQTNDGLHYALENHLLHTEQELNLPECIAVCLSHHSCHSINYDESRRHCEINSASRDGVSSSDWRKRQGSAHYKRVQIFSY